MSDSTGDTEETEPERRWSSALFRSFVRSLPFTDSLYFGLWFKRILKRRWAGLSAHQSTFGMIKLYLLWGQVMNHDCVGPGLPGISMRLSPQCQLFVPLLIIWNDHICRDQQVSQSIWLMVLLLTSDLSLSHCDCWYAADAVGFPVFGGNGFSLISSLFGMAWAWRRRHRCRGHTSEKSEVLNMSVWLLREDIKQDKAVMGSCCVYRCDD